MKAINKESLLILITVILCAYRINAQTWEEIGFNLPEGDTVSYNTEITFANKDIGWLFTHYNRISKLYKTINGGKSWQTIKVYNGIEYAVVYSIEPDFFYMIAGNYGSSIGYAARFTTDGGITWDSTGIWDEGLFRALHFLSKEKGIAITDSYCWTTSDGGQKWDRKGQIDLPMDIYFFNEKLGWAVGEVYAGYIAKTTDGGSTWKYINNNYFPPLNGITFIDSLKGFAVGAIEGGGCYQTTDGGENWQTSPTPNMYGVDLEFLNDKDGWVTQYDQVKRTNDGGDTWTNQLYGYKGFKFIKLIILKNDKVAYVLGVNQNNNTATLLRADLSNISSVKENTEAIPNKFYLYQNYPNPFNPSTTIDYSIPRRSFVTITIFDVLGRNVTSLVNSEMAAGNHKVSFNGSSFSSGIYFYQLKADDYITNKKMVLVR